MNKNEKLCIVDMCCTTNFSYPTPVENGKNGFDRACDGGLNCAVTTISAYDESFMTTVGRITDLLHFINEHQERITLAESVEDVLSARSSMKMAVVIALQTASPVEKDWAIRLPALQKLGVRMMQLTYNEYNRLGSGCLEAVDTGLTEYGRQVVNGMRHFGILVDIAHAGAQTARDVLRMSKLPVVCSHANARALSDHPRNLSDDVLKRLADTGGVVGLCSWSPLNRRESVSRPTIDHFVEQIDYVANLIGIEHVGIGLDHNENVRANPSRDPFQIIYSDASMHFDNHHPSVEGIESMGCFPDIAEKLEASGYTRDEMAKILGGNFLRVAKAVWGS